MKYVVTQKQIDGIREQIKSYLDGYLTPFNGWESPKSYKKDVEMDGEIFLYFEDDDFGAGFGSEIPHMWYTTCDNHNLSEPLPEEECPAVGMNSAKYDALDGFFGEIWKPIFFEWFESHTGLKVKHVESQEW